MGSILLSRGGTLDGWETTHGVKVIYPPRILSDGKQRGGCFPCAPNFGRVPQSEAWRLAQGLPPHGLLRRETVIPVTREGVDAGNWFAREYAQAFGGTDVFPWRFSATILWQYEKKTEQLVVSLTVRRLSECTVADPMPLSGGLHPYFATAGQRFEVDWGAETRLTSVEDFSVGRFIPWGNCPVEMIQPGNKIIQIINLGNFDRIVVWSDSKEYLCIEPTFGTDKVIMLERGQMWSAACTIIYMQLAC